MDQDGIGPPQCLEVSGDSPLPNVLSTVWTIVAGPSTTSRNRSEVFLADYAQAQSVIRGPLRTRFVIALHRGFRRAARFSESRSRDLNRAKSPARGYYAEGCRVLCRAMFGEVERSGRNPEASR